MQTVEYKLGGFGIFRTLKCTITKDGRTEKLKVSLTSTEARAVAENSERGMNIKSNLRASVELKFLK